MILHTWKRTSGFLIHTRKEKNDIAHLKAHKWFFQLTQEKERNDIAHTNRNWPKCNHSISHLQLPLDIFAIIFCVSLQLHYN
jgi:hypothetical protein